jgi:dTDP-4-amino-4,6-dideoxygalactose transaminase
MIPFNKPFLSGNELEYIQQSVRSGKISGNGIFTQKCQKYFEEKFGFKKALLTTSCTDALEMCAILADLKPGDEVIIPSFTFVSTALAFIRQGARVIFADSRSDNPGIDEDKIEGLITSKTRAIVPVHYAGVACDMDKIMGLAKKYDLLVIEDAAQAIDSFYNGVPLGSIGHMSAFSFHETKNINSGEGGLIAINDDRFVKRSEIIWEKGTNRSEFFRGEVAKYSWVDIGSSFLPSEIMAAYLWAQLENLEEIQKKRKNIWDTYNSKLESFLREKNIQIPFIPWYATNNGHMYYFVCKNLEQRTALIAHLKNNGIHAVFHYLSLHKSPYYIEKHDGRVLINSNLFEECLIRLPFFCEITENEIDYITENIKSFLQKA